MPDLDDFLNQLASGSPVPGGGSVAALHVALGNALLSMVCELTLGRPAYADVEAEIRGIKEAATTGRARAQQLVDEDEQAFDKVSRAMRLPRSSDSEKSARRQTIQDALKAAVAPPLETMTLAVSGAHQAVALVQIGNPSAISDVACAALAFSAGFSSARLNVDINVASIKDQTFVEKVRQELKTIGEVESTVKSVFERAREVIGDQA